MTPTRISLSTAAPKVYRAIDALDSSVKFDPSLIDLIKLRASQLNGCGYCVDYHSGDAVRQGQDTRRVWAISAWRETDFFDEREQAALALTEALTDLPKDGVSDEVYAEAARHFPDTELANLIGAIIAINAWNRVGVGLALRPAPLAA
jgi:AhpD family alkylhydroperoxidase